ncbi:MAG: hypothetical protein CM15mP78_16810 [Candidatus Poseidoniales archaeon]|nr:MAG: hypothetical protein CM15mP78_16810 [Candidatus Poseidoniales archaeon]
MNKAATTPQNRRMMVRPFGLEGSQTLGVLAIMSEKYDAISTKNKIGKAM